MCAMRSARRTGWSRTTDGRSFVPSLSEEGRHELSPAEKCIQPVNKEQRGVSQPRLPASSPLCQIKAPQRKCQILHLIKMSRHSCRVFVFGISDDRDFTPPQESTGWDASNGWRRRTMSCPGRRSPPVSTAASQTWAAPVRSPSSTPTLCHR